MYVSKLKKIQYLVLFIVLLLPMKTVFSAGGAASMSAQVATQKKQDGVDTRTLPEVVQSTSADRFTQTEAHLSLSRIRQLIDKNYDIDPYLDIISTIIANEAKYAANYYAFYHTTPNAWRLAQDLYGLLYAKFKSTEVTRDFKFLRFSDDHAVNSTAQGWLVNELRTKGLVDDNSDTKFIMISANFALFGNVGFPGECSWEYFKKPQNHETPNRGVYEQMMKDFGLTKKYVDEIMALFELYDTQEDTIIQILVPKDKVDDIGYLAWSTGIPAHEETIDWVLQHAKGKSYTRNLKPTLEQLQEKFAKAKEKSPLYKDMVESIKSGDFSLDAFLKIYRNKPWELENINDVSARLLFTPDVLLNPKSGVKFYRFSTASRFQLKEYNTKLNEIVDKLIANKELKDAKKASQGSMSSKPMMYPSKTPIAKPSMYPTKSGLKPIGAK